MLLSKLRKRVLIWEHSETLGGIADDAATYDQQADVTEVIELYEQIEKKREQVLGPNYPDTPLPRGGREAQPPPYAGPVSRIVFWGAIFLFYTVLYDFPFYTSVMYSRWFPAALFLLSLLRLPLSHRLSCIVLGAFSVVIRFYG
jgi:hypothetical protein